MGNLPPIIKNHIMANGIRLTKEMVEKDFGVHVGDTIKITHMDDPYIPHGSYDGKEGVVELIDSMGQLHGTWGGLAVIPGEDRFVVIGRKIDPSIPEEEIGGAPSPGRQRRAAEKEAGRWSK